MKLTDVSVVRRVMDEHSVSFKKRLGQNFLINEAIPIRIADACGASSEDGILEIGPGIGTLTAELARRYAKVAAVEIDTELIPVLKDTLAEFDNVTVINADIMKTDICALIAEHFDNMKVSVCANLPYYITTPVIMHLLEAGAPIENITLMIQREVADRLCSAAGEREYGAVTAAVNYYAEVKKLFSVSAGSFMPAPKVDSTVIGLTVYKSPPVSPRDVKLMFRVIKASFAQRRKTLSNALSAEFRDIDKNTLTGIITSLGFSPTVRGECLTLHDYSNISDEILQKYNTV